MNLADVFTAAQPKKKRKEKYFIPTHIRVGMIMAISAMERSGMSPIKQNKMLKEVFSEQYEKIGNWENTCWYLRKQAKDLDKFLAEHNLSVIVEVNDNPREAA